MNRPLENLSFEGLVLYVDAIALATLRTSTDPKYARPALPAGGSGAPLKGWGTCEVCGATCIEVVQMLTAPADDGRVFVGLSCVDYAGDAYGWQLATA